MLSSTMDTAMELSFWKEEPLSPVFSELESEQSDVWQLFEDEVAKEAESISLKEEPKSGSTWLPDSPGDTCDSFLSEEHTYSANSRAQLASQLLQDLDDVLIKEEPFSDWLEQKVDLPIFEDLSSHSKDESCQSPPYPTFTPPPPVAVHVPLQLALQTQPLAQPHIVPLTGTSLQQVQVQMAPAQDLTDTQTLLQEFECVFGKVEQSHGALTPPQSPPPQQCALGSAPTPGHDYHRSQPSGLTPLLPPNEDFSAMTPNPMLIAEVDEIVRSRVAESWPDSSAFRPPSPCTSSNSSFSEDADPDPDAEPEAEPSSESDPDWCPDTPSPQARPAAPSKARGRKRASSRPYPNSLEDKRMRKKEQNKNAATRYRMKKKAEVEEILSEENELKHKHDQLQAKVTDLSQEIRYLKNLMREVFRAKGLIK